MSHFNSQRPLGQREIKEKMYVLEILDVILLLDIGFASYAARAFILLKKTYPYATLSIFYIVKLWKNKRREDLYLFGHFSVLCHALCRLGLSNLAPLQPLISRMCRTILRDDWNCPILWRETSCWWRTLPSRKSKEIVLKYFHVL